MPACTCKTPKCTCACHPRDSDPRIHTKAELQKSTVPLGHGHGNDYATTAETANRTARSGPSARGAPAHDKTAQQKTHLDFGGERRWETTNRKDYTKKTGEGYSKVKPDVDPYATHIPKDDAEANAPMISEQRKSFVPLPDAKRAPFHPKLQGAHFKLGRDESTDYKTTSETMLVEHPLGKNLGPKLTKAQLQVSSIPKGDTKAWGQDLMSSSAASFKEPVSAGPGGSDAQTTNFHRACHIDVAGTGKKGIYDTTNRTDYTEKNGETFTRAAPVIDPHRSNIPVGSEAPTGKSLARESFTAHPRADRKPCDPKLQGSHLSFGREPRDYVTTSGGFFAAPPSNHARREAAMAKADLQRSSLVLGTDDSDKRSTTQVAHGPVADGARERVPHDFHGETNFSVTGGRSDEGTWVTTMGHDYTPKSGKNERARPAVDPYKSSLPPHPFSKDEWKKDAVTTCQACFHAHPDARRAPKDPALQSSNIKLGGNSSEWSTTSGTMHAPHACCECVRRRNEQGL